MLEKTGQVVLTEDELKDARKGTLPPRLMSEWGLTLSELSAIIASGNYQTTGSNSSPNKSLPS